MSAMWNSARPRRIRRGAALTMVFAGVLATGAATESWSGEPGAPVPESADRALPGAAGEDGSRAARQADEGRDADSDEAAERLVSRSGDRWSAAYTAREYAGLERTLDGEYVGTGISVRRAVDSTGRRTVVVARVQDGSPAAKAGIRAGDRLHAVDGAKVGDRPVTDVVGMLRGSVDGGAGDGAGAQAYGAGDGTGKRGDGHAADDEATADEGAAPGSPVVLDLGRDGRRWTADVERARLTAGTVTSDKLAPHVTRIRITRFTEDSGSQVRRAVRDLPEGDGILLDLRGNSGGLVTEAADAASALLDGGLVATYDDDGTQRTLHAAPGGDTEAPVVVLVDGGTMSAAELLTGALRDRGRAVVVGTRTFGKGSVQMPHQMPDGSVAELTVGDYATPSGRAVPEEGLVPDLAVPSTRDAEARARSVLSGLTSGS
ncbi:S41 family peptidase [Streptomyces phytohabitans]|uniref:S41 family peptidase n=1 Tax=Streptomyces phytohabitans TaxID=1150371 RepID=UPI00345B7B44